VVRDDRDRAVGATATVVIPAVFVVVAVLLPWATYDNRTSGRTTDVGTGATGAVLVALALLAVGCSVLGAAKPSSRFATASVVCAVGGVVVAVVLWFASIVSANDLADRAAGGSRTSHAFGAVLGVLASVALVVACLIVTQRRTRVPAS
jgi:quinol-cytochrome oxidoreductase complex cytochrome b subunit